MFLIQIKNIFACRQANVGSSMHAYQFRHADLVVGETALAAGLRSDHGRPWFDHGRSWSLTMVVHEITIN